jgi:retinol dehydrogenase 12
MHAHLSLLPTVFNVLFVCELNNLLPPEARLVANAVNPGFCKSDLRRNLPTWDKFLCVLHDLCYGRTAEQGSRRLVLGALGFQDREDKLSGAYVSERGLQETALVVRLYMYCSC